MPSRPFQASSSLEVFGLQVIGLRAVDGAVGGCAAVFANFVRKTPNRWAGLRRHGIRIGLRR